MAFLAAAGASFRNANAAAGASSTDWDEPRCSSPLPKNFLRRISSRQKGQVPGGLRVRLGVDNPERYGKSLSERPSLSEAWGLADLLYKLFIVRDRWGDKMARTRSS
jgi:hypothetical protein